MSSQLDILALEPFFGGVRRTVLESLIRCSRHRWTVLKLPPRRIERRLTAAAHWFSEQLARHWVGKVDLIFTSDALNLADFFRLSPQLVGTPAIVYFHANQLPAIESTGDGPLDLINLNTAMAANEIWFNSKFHLEDFFGKAATMVVRHTELSSRSPIDDLTHKTRLMAPPIDLNVIKQISEELPQEQQKRTLFVETRDADIHLLNAALRILQRRKSAFNLITVGPVESLDPSFPRRTIPEADLEKTIIGLLQAPVFLSTKMNCNFDPHAVRALAAGCWPLLPHSGAYGELLPPSVHIKTIYKTNDDDLANKLMDVWMEDIPSKWPALIQPTLRAHDSINACKAIDERIERVVEQGREPDLAEIVE